VKVKTQMSAISRRHFCLKAFLEIGSAADGL
jgi:hypothetical protein